MVSNIKLLHLYNFLQLPIHFNFSVNIFITPNVNSTNLLVIRHSKSFHTLSSSVRSCLGALYWPTQKQSRTRASSRLPKPVKKIFELAENTWAVYSTGMVNTNQVCANQNSVKSRLTQSGETIMVDPWCYIYTMNHIISAEKYETMGIDEDHGLGWRTSRLIQQGKHKDEPWGHSGPENEV